MPPKIVADSSVILKWLYREDEKYLEQAEELLHKTLTGRTALFAPELAKYEVSNVLLTAKKLSPTRADEAIEFLFSLPIHFIPDSAELSKSTYRIGEEAQITYYDASFMALAKEEKATLVTDNPKHQKRVKGVKIIPLKDYR